jgi:hypothetical protein
MKVSRFAVTQLQLMRYILFFKFLTVFHTFHVQRLELSSVWALLAAFENPLQIPQSDSHGVFEGAFVRDVDSLSWMGNNT